MKTFSILGCGWLGLSLLPSLKYEYKIKIATRSEIKAKNFDKLGFSSYLLPWNNFFNLKEFLLCDVLFISLPPKDESYLLLLESIYKNVAASCKIIFISSTSIYPKKDLLFDENYFIEDDDNSLVNKAERIVKKRSNIIFRCAGLMGYDRIAGKYFANKVVNNSMQKVNYVHKDDVIKAVKFVLDKNLTGIYNLCALKHPTKKEVYLKNAKEYKFKEGIFNSTIDLRVNLNRTISTKKLCKEGFEYIYSNPLFFKYSYSCVLKDRSPASPNPGLI